MRSLKVLLTGTLLLFSLRFAAQVTSNFSANPVSGCSPVVVAFTDLSTGGPNYWEWHFGNGNISFSQNPSAAYITAGNYTVTLIVSDGTSWDTLVLTNLITVFADPTALFAPSVTGGCAPLSVQFTNQSIPGSGAINSWFWDFGDGNTSTQQNPVHVYAAQGTYSVSFIVTDVNGCSDNLSQVNLITVTPKPTANFAALPLQGCAVPLAVTFSNSSTGTGPLTYLWDFGDGNTSTVVTPIHTYTSFGQYTVTLIVTNGSGCSDTLVRLNYIQLQPLIPLFTANPTTICRGESVQFTNQSTGFTSTYSYLWNFGDGTTSGVESPSHTFYSSGVFSVVLTVTSSLGCTLSASQLITVLPAPSANFSGTPVFSCTAPLTVSFSNLSAGGISWDWDFGDGGSSTLQNPTYIYTTEGSFSVTLTVTGINGCTHDTTLINYVVVDFPEADFYANPFEGCVPLDVQFRDTSRSSDSMVSWQWDFGDGATSTLEHPFHTYASTGTFTVSLVIVTASGCTDTLIRTAYIRTGNPPLVNFIATPTLQCIGDSIQFTDLSVGGNQWNWEFGDGGTSTEQDPGYAYNDTGTFDVTLIVSDNGCRDTLVIPNYITIVGVRAGIDYVIDCDDPFTVQFIDNSQYGPDAWLWDFGDGNTSTLSNPTHTYADTGAYTVTQTVFDLTNGCDDTAVTTVTIADLSVDFSAAPLTGCRPLTVSFTDLSVDVSAYQWDFGDGGSSGQANPIYTYTQNGIFTVTLIVTDVNGCSDTLIRPDYITVEGPFVGFNGSPAIGCAPLQVAFTDTSFSPGATVIQWSWTFGDGATSTQQNPTHLYDSAGNYTVTLQVTDDAGCSGTVTRPAYVIATDPIAQFNIVPFACPGDPIIFANQSQGVGLTYSWDFGDSGTSTATNPSHVYADSGIYFVELQVTDINGCVDSITDTIDIRQPVASFAAAPTFASCPPLTVNFSDLSYGNITSWYWTFGDGSFSTLQNPSHTYVMPGDFDVTLIVTTNLNCTDTIRMDDLVTIQGPTGSFAFSPQSGCSPITVDFVATTTNTLNYTWDFGDGTVITTTSNSISHTYFSAGVFHPVVVLDDGLGCVAGVGSPDSVVVFASPIVTISPDTTICYGDTVLLNVGGGSSYLWTPSISLACVACDSTLSFPQVTTDYVVEVTAANGCVDTGFVTVTVLPFPFANTTGDVIICRGQSIGISAFGGTQYLWQPPNGLSCTNCQSPTAGPFQTITYTVEVSNGYCSDFDSLTVTVWDTVPGNICPDTAICFGGSATLWALGQASAISAPSYQWSPGFSLSNDTSANVIATPFSTTTYTVVMNNETCLPTTRTVTVTVHPVPFADAGPDLVTFAGMPVTLDGTASGNNPLIYAWTPPAGLDCPTCEDPTAQLTSTTTFQIEVTDVNGCRKTDSVTVRVLDRCEESLVFVPNTFTPNGDGVNDQLLVRSFGVKEISMFRIFDRWGNVVFETPDVTMGWDGSYQAKSLDPAVFVYTVEGVCLNDEDFVTTGNVAIVK